MALNKHMAAAVAEMEADLAQLALEMGHARTCKEKAFFARDFGRIKAAIKTIDALYSGPEPKPAKPAKPARYVHGGTALGAAAGLREPMTAPALAAAVGCTPAAASKWLQRWEVDGWLVKTGHGQYVHAAKFPATVIPAG